MIASAPLLCIASWSRRCAIARHCMLPRQLCHTFRNPAVRCLLAPEPHLPHGPRGLQPLLEVRLDGGHQLLLLPFLQLSLGGRVGGQWRGG